MFTPVIIFFKGKFKYLFIFFFLILLFSNYFYGSYKINSETKRDELEKINFKIVSAGNKLSEFKDQIFVISKLIKMSEPEKDQNTIFVWPEGVILNQEFKNSTEIKNLFSKNFSDKHLIILGANTKKKYDNKEYYFNSFLIVDKNLNIINQYDKQKLVPFGEFLPFKNFFKKIGIKKITHGYHSFSKGEKNSVITMNFDDKMFNILPLICYEIIFPNLVESKTNNFNFIVNISEDAWFGDSIGPQQHFVKAIFRSIESKSFMIRSANMGVSAFISPEGKILKNLNPKESGNIEMNLPILKTKNDITNKNLIFTLLLILYAITFIILKKFKI